MRLIRNMLAGCVAMVAGLAAAQEIESMPVAEPYVDSSTFFAEPGCCPADGCQAPTGCDVTSGCEAPDGCGVATIGCAAPACGCASPTDCTCVVPATGCGMESDCVAAAYFSGCEAPCGGCGACGDCRGDECARVGRGGWLAMQRSTMKYGWHGEAGYLCGGGGLCGSCGHGCNNGCGNGCNGCGGYLAYKLRCIFGVSGGMTHSPGHGYVLPMRRPIYDVAHPYTHMWSRNGLGLGPQVSSPAYRNVYMPTDTTQLGYSYGHVPYWMPRAGMVPPVPVPDAYHNRICVEDRCNGGPCHYSSGPVEYDGTPAAEPNGVVPTEIDADVEPQPVEIKSAARGYRLPQLSQIPE